MKNTGKTSDENGAKKVKIVQKILIVCAIIILIALFYFLDAGKYFSLDYIKASQERFALLYKEHMVAVIAAYMGIYITMSALSLPGAAVLTLLGGALFGFVTGTIVVSFASTIGATLACLVARFLLRDWVQNKVGGKLNVINEGVEKEGAFYLFTMRLIPAFPFWLVNLAMGLTRIPLITYYWVSQIGMLPATMVFVFAGRELGQVESLSGILSPGLIIALVILGIFP
ncbi:MAG: TVP38/TMEM64 family protein, partial [Proteobacteria bacterium]|nr:TVP38/TMEM64 family protein [Pseudomonadota bacterium]